MLMPGRTFNTGNLYRFGFNGQENDNEVKGTGNQQDFGARIYDPRIGRWLSIDPLQKKYPDLTPYAFVGNSPVRFIDYDGRDFGVKIDHAKKTIVIVANVYTTSRKAYEQALKAANQWNTKSTTVDGYTVSFQFKVNKPAVISDAEVIEQFGTVNFYKKNGKLKRDEVDSYKDLLMRVKATNAADADPVGNSFSGNKGINSSSVSGEKFTGGQTMNNEHADMNTHDEHGDMGSYEDLVAHEFGHLLGLSDEGRGTYFSKGGIMEYKGMDLAPVSDNDVKDVLKFAKDAIGGKLGDRNNKVKVLENTGKSDGTNPLGIKNE